MTRMTPQNLPQHFASQVRQTIYIEHATESLYNVALLLDDSLQMTWERLPPSQKARYRDQIIDAYIKLGIINSDWNRGDHEPQ